MTKAEERARLVLDALAAKPSARHYGWELHQATKIRTGPLYVTLAQLEAEGRIVSGWDNAEQAGYHRRRWYRAAP